MLELTQGRVIKNQWSKNPFGLYAPRRNFPVQGLVLYLPLGHPDLSGSPFLSKDLNAHSCTVTDATWGIQGRTFDGIDDKIVVGSSTAFSFPYDYTLEAWVKQATLVTERHQFIIAFFPSSGNGFRWVSRRNATGNYMGYYSDEAAAWLESNVSLTLDTWNHVAVAIVNGGNSIFYVNGVAVRTATSLAQPTQSATTPWIASEGTNFTKGIIGEVRIYNRALSAARIQYIYLATKWRYQ